jgi:hypothetical protein
MSRNPFAANSMNHGVLFRRTTVSACPIQMRSDPRVMACERAPSTSLVAAVRKDVDVTAIDHEPELLAVEIIHQSLTGGPGIHSRRRSFHCIA